MDKFVQKDNTVIRKMAISDLEEVISLERVIFGTYPDMESYKKSCLRPENIYMVAKNSSNIIAYCTIVASYETADLCNIAVKEGYRRCHIAQKLLSECILCCKDIGVERILLEVRKDNIPALKFYAKMNFKKIGIRKGYYKNPYADAVIMEKSL